jgi:hypothetical protein
VPKEDQQVLKVLKVLKDFKEQLEQQDYLQGHKGHKGQLDFKVLWVRQEDQLVHKVLKD